MKKYKVSFKLFVKMELFISYHQMLFLNPETDSISY
mgnify:CR=1 FL=1